MNRERITLLLVGFTIGFVLAQFIPLWMIVLGIVVIGILLVVRSSRGRS